jgi:hypothetical protein
MKRLIYATIVFSLFLSVIAVAGFYSFGRSITMNLVLHIGNSDDDDIITSSDNYISAQESGKVIAIVSESAFGTRLEHYADDYLLQIRQPLSNSRFFLVFTKGDNRTISRTVTDIVQNRFGEHNYTKPGVFPLFLRLEYYGIDLISKARWTAGQRELLIRNNGDKKITIEVIE